LLSNSAIKIDLKLELNNFTSVKVGGQLTAEDRQNFLQHLQKIINHGKHSATRPLFRLSIGYVAPSDNRTILQRCR